MRTRSHILFASKCLFAASLGVLATTAYVPRAEAQATAKKPSNADRAAARTAYNAGTEAYQRGDYPAAAENFQKANAIIPSPHAQYWIAASLDQAGRSADAIAAYETALAHPDIAKIGDEKVATARARLDALRAAAEAPKEPEPQPEPPAEPEPAPVEAQPEPMPLPPPQVEQREEDELKPKANLIELGVLGGMLFISDQHNLRRPPAPQADYDALTWMAGLRAAYFPLAFLGVELEYARGWGEVQKPLEGPAPHRERSAVFDSLRGHVIGQLPSGRLVPFALLGAGFLRADSKRLGEDYDALLHGGLGAKFIATEYITPRLDFRLDLTQKRDGEGIEDGLAVHPEILLGLSVTLGR